MYSQRPHIVVQIATEQEYQLFREYPLIDHYSRHITPRLPMYARIDLDRTKIIGRQTNVFNVGAEYIATYNSGISVDEFLGITDVSKPSMEYW